MQLRPQTAGSVDGERVLNDTPVANNGLDWNIDETSDRIAITHASAMPRLRCSLVRLENISSPEQKREITTRMATINRAMRTWRRRDFDQLTYDYL